MLPIRMTDPYESSTGAQMANLLLNPVGERGNIHVLPLSKGIQKVLKSDGITFRFVSWIACCQETKSVGLRLWACLNPCKPCVESHFVCRLDDDLAWVAQNQTVANGLNCRLYCKPILTGSSISMKLLKPIIWTNHFSINEVNRTFGSKPHSLGICSLYGKHYLSNFEPCTSWVYGVPSGDCAMPGWCFDDELYCSDCEYSTGVFWILADAWYAWVYVVRAEI